MNGLRGSHHLSRFYLGVELTFSSIKYDTLCITWPNPPHCFQLFLNPDSSPRRKGGSKCVERFTASLRRAFHFSGRDGLLCSPFNSQHHIIGHHLGLSLLLSSSVSSSDCPLHVCCICMCMVGSHTSVVNPLHFPETLCNVIMRSNYKTGLPSTSPRSVGERCVCIFCWRKKNSMARGKERERDVREVTQRAFSL